MVDEFRVARLKRLHERCLEANEKHPTLNCVAFRSDDPLIWKFARERVWEDFPFSLFDLPMSISEKSDLELIASWWLRHARDCHSKRYAHFRDRIGELRSREDGEQIDAEMNSRDYHTMNKWDPATYRDSSGLTPEQKNAKWGPLLRDWRNDIKLWRESNGENPNDWWHESTQSHISNWFMYYVTNMFLTNHRGMARSHSRHALSFGDPPQDWLATFIDADFFKNDKTIYGSEYEKNLGDYSEKNFPKFRDAMDTFSVLSRELMADFHSAERQLPLANSTENQTELWLHFLFKRMSVEKGRRGPIQIRTLPSNVFHASAQAITLLDVPHTMSNLDISNPRVLRINERNKWIYERVIKGDPYKEIAYDLMKIAPEKGWETVDSDNGIKDRAKKYAEDNSLPEIPKRKESKSK